MNSRSLLTASLGLLLIGLSACVQQQYYWGDYESSLYDRHLHAGQVGETEAIGSLEALIAEAGRINSRVPPGVYADYGYLLLKQGRTDDALVALSREAELYQESKPLMDRMVSRIEKKKAEGQKPEEKKSSP